MLKSNLYLAVLMKIFQSQTLDIGRRRYFSTFVDFKINFAFLLFFNLIETYYLDIYFQ